MIYQKKLPMKKNLNIGTIKLPIEVVTKAIAIIAKRGAGKTYAAGVLAEEMLSTRVPIVIFDPIDVWWGLRLKKDGKKKGFEIPVFGIQHSDLELTRDMGKLIADAIVKTGTSCIISTFGMSKKAQRHLITEFSERILNINDQPRHIFIEEAHEYVPQRVSGSIGAVFNAVSNLVVMGRNRGLGVTLINQRAATINKDVLTQIDILIALRSVGPQDRKALKEWVDYHGAEDDLDAFVETLPSLPTGEAWIWSPELLNLFERISIRAKKTFHPDREILSGFKMPTMQVLGVENFVDVFKKLSHKSDKDPVTIDEYKKETTRLRHENTILKRQQPAPVSQGVSQEQVTKVVSKAVEKAINDRDRQWKSTIQIWQTNIINAHIVTDKLLCGPAPKLPGYIPAETPGPATTATQARSAVTTQPISQRRVQQPTPAYDGEINIGTGGAYRMLRNLVSLYPRKFTRPQLGMLSKMKHTGGGYGNALSQLRRAGLIIEDNGFITASETGIEYFDEAMPEPMTSDEVIEMWRSKLGGGSLRMFDYLLDIYPNYVDRQSLADAAGMVSTGGGFGNALSVLRTNCLIQEAGGTVRINEDLYVDEG